MESHPADDAVLEIHAEPVFRVGGDADPGPGSRLPRLDQANGTLLGADDAACAACDRSENPGRVERAADVFGALVEQRELAYRARETGVLAPKPLEISGARPGTVSPSTSTSLVECARP